MEILFIGVSSLMIFAVPDGCELFAAVLALVGFLTSMSPHMYE
jgi:hypothetical protein